MDELKRILAIKKQDRSEKDLEYLKLHEKELTEEMKLQLKAEDNILEEIEITFPKKIEKKDIAEKAKMIVRSFASVVKDLGNGIMEAIISSEALDRHGEKIDMKGMSIKEYMKNPILADAHNYDNPSVGRTHKLTKTKDGKLIAKFEFAKDISDKAKLLYDLYSDGFQFAFSIGFMAEEVDGNTYTKSTMLEFSPVLVPANAEALLLAKKKGLDKEDLVIYIKNDMYKLEDILKKEIKDLTVGEIAFLKENKQKLTGEQSAKFASVLEEKKDNTAEVVKAAVEKAVAPLKDQMEEFKKSEKTIVKNISLGNAENFKKANEDHKKKLNFLYYVKYVIQQKNLAAYERVVGKDAMNTTDTGEVLPPAEFIAAVERLEEQYGVARRFATVRQSTNGNGITYLFGDDDVEIFDTAEAGSKKSTKLSYAQKSLLWRKFAGILPIVDELTEDSAVDLWADATARFARAYAKQEDQLVFTETSAVSPKNKGVLEVAGTNAVTMSGTGSDDGFEDLVYDDLVDMITGVPTPSAANGRFYFHRTLLGVLMKMKDDMNRPIWLPSVAGGAPATILNKPYELVEVMPGVSDSGPNTPFMIFGDLRYVTLGERTGLNIKMFDTGLVGDPDEEDQETNTLNLLTQDMQAMRAVKRMNAVVRFPSAFSILKTALVNS